LHASLMSYTHRLHTEQDSAPVAVADTATLPVAAELPPPPLPTAPPPAAPEPPALAPHRYPPLILAFAGVILAALLYSCLSIPKYLKASRALKRADALLANREFPAAEAAYAQVETIAAPSPPARLGGAKAILQDGDPSNDEAALDLLDGMYLSADDAAELRPLIPQKLRERFIQLEPEP
jgi:hypothetical protein